MPEWSLGGKPLSDVEIESAVPLFCLSRILNKVGLLTYLADW